MSANSVQGRSKKKIKSNKKQTPVLAGISAVKKDGAVAVHMNYILIIHVLMIDCFVSNRNIYFKKCTISNIKHTLRQSLQ